MAKGKTPTKTFVRKPNPPELTTPGVPDEHRGVAAVMYTPLVDSNRPPTQPSPCKKNSPRPILVTGAFDGNRKENAVKHTVKGRSTQTSRTPNPPKVTFSDGDHGNGRTALRPVFDGDSNGAVEPTAQSDNVPARPKKPTIEGKPASGSVHPQPQATGTDDAKERSKYLSRVCQADTVDIDSVNLGEIDPRFFEKVVSSLIRHPNGRYRSGPRGIFKRANFDAMWKEAVVKFGLRGRLEVSLMSYGTKYEYWARRVIDCFIDAFLGGNIAPYSICQLEMTLAASREAKGDSSNLEEGRLIADGVNEVHTENPGQIQKGSTSLKVTGSVDYMLITLPSSHQDMFSKTLEEATPLDRTTAIFHPATAGEINFLLIEAKRMDPQKDISTHRPQILCQAHATMKKTRRDKMPWVLSNGDAWVFGLSVMEGSNRRCIYFEPQRLFSGVFATGEGTPNLSMPDDGRGWTELGNPEDTKPVVPDGKRQQPTKRQLDAIMGRAKTIMRILTIWHSSPPKALWVALQEAQVAS